MPFINKSEATKWLRYRKENGKCTNATNLKSHGPVNPILHWQNVDYRCNCLGCTRTSHRGDMLVILFRLAMLCLTASEKTKNFTGSPFRFLFHDSGCQQSFLQAPKAHVSVRTLLMKHVWFTQKLLCGWLECPNFPGLFTSEATRHYTWNITPKWWIRQGTSLYPVYGGYTCTFYILRTDITQTKTTKWRQCMHAFILKCPYDQILDIHFFTFLYTIGLA